MPTSNGEYFCLSRQIYNPLTAFELYRLFRDGKSPSVLLESAAFSSSKGRYSIIAQNPFLILKAKKKEVNLESYGVRENLKGSAFLILQKLLKEFQGKRGSSFPTYTGGAIGFFSYEAKNLLEKGSEKANDDLGLPDAYFLFFDESIVIDHKTGKTHLFAHARTGKNPKKAKETVEHKLEALERRVEKAMRSMRGDKKVSAKSPDVSGISTTPNRETFIRMVKKAKQYIRKGDIYQANLSQRFNFSVEEDSLDIYERLRLRNPSSFFAYLDALDFQILSGSPERLVRLEAGVLETRPIAGTRRRGDTPEEDRKKSDELLLSQKERAEHIMLVDLERNDFGRVCEYGSVRVDELMSVENYSHVKHIVSNVRGKLRPDLDAVDALMAVFPGGTITGAPKLRSMEIIDELEPVARGPYTGSLGYLDFSGSMDFNILIRSLVIQNKKAYLQVGAGIVADSVPEKEYEETLCKAQGVLSAVFGEENTRRFFAGRIPAAGLS